MARGCSLETKDLMDFTAIHLASLQGSAEIVKTLVKAGCNVDCETKVRGYRADEITKRKLSEILYEPSGPWNR